MTECLLVLFDATHPMQPLPLHGLHSVQHVYILHKASYGVLCSYKPHAHGGFYQCSFSKASELYSNYSTASRILVSITMRSFPTNSMWASCCSCVVSPTIV